MLFIITSINGFLFTSCCFGESPGYTGKHSKNRLGQLRLTGDDASLLMSPNVVTHTCCAQNQNENSYWFNPV